MKYSNLNGQHIVLAMFADTKETKLKGSYQLCIRDFNKCQKNFEVRKTNVNETHLFKERTSSILFYFRDLLSQNCTNLEKLIELEKKIRLTTKINEPEPGYSNE